jgi:hypothetical protein
MLQVMLMLVATVAYLKLRSIKTLERKDRIWIHVCGGIIVIVTLSLLGLTFIT